MKVSLNTVKAYDATYKSGYDKDYPSLELVRIEKIFFKKKGTVLDFGCGPGTNGIHLMRKGYDLTFCDISKFALKKVKNKISKFANKKKFKIINLLKETVKKLLIFGNNPVLLLGLIRWPTLSLTEVIKQPGSISFNSSRNNLNTLFLFSISSIFFAQIGLQSCFSISAL